MSETEAPAAARGGDAPQLGDRDNQNMRRRLARIERGLLNLQVMRS